MSFTGRSIAITGGASGIGFAITKGLASQGASVYIADISESCPSELVKEPNIHFTGNCDITKRAACQSFIASIPGRLDGLVNCAGICPSEGDMASDELFARIMAVNTTGTWNMGTEAIIRMNKQEVKSSPGLLPGTERSVGAGSIVNIGSGASLRGIPKMAAYCASKHAVLGITRSWAKEWPLLQVNAVAPGVTNTPLVLGGSAENSDPESIKKLATQLASRIPKGRMAYATDIADAVLFLLSDASSFVTGQVIPVNGGAD